MRLASPRMALAGECAVVIVCVGRHIATAAEKYLSAEPAGGIRSVFGVPHAVSGKGSEYRACRVPFFRQKPWNGTFFFATPN